MSDKAKAIIKAVLVILLVLWLLALTAMQGDLSLEQRGEREELQEQHMWLTLLQLSVNQLERRIAVLEGR